MEEEDRQAVRTDLGFAVAEDAGAGLGQRACGRGKIGDFEADVMHAASGVVGEEFCDRRVVAERRHQLELGVLELDKDHGDAVLGQIVRVVHVGAELVAVLGCGGGEIGDSDGDVVEAADHRLLSLPRSG